MRRNPILFPLLLLLMAASAFAHDPGLSSIRMVAAADGIDATLTIHYADFKTLDAELDSAGGAALTAADFLRVRDHVGKLAGGALVLAIEGGQTLAPALPPQADLIANDNLQVRLHFPAAAPGQTLLISSPLVPELPHGHREFVELANAAGKPLGEGFLTASSNQLAFELPADFASAVAPRPFRFGEFFLLGVTHLLTGYDHLLFLAGLLLVCRTMWKAFEMLTLFTIAHSVTLTLVTLDVIKSPGALVEPAIALSIAYIGIENIFRAKADLSWRGVLTFAFGLIHGMGFAGALKDLGVGADGGSVFRPLFFFSLGLESTQLGLAALIFPLLLALRKRPAFPRIWVPACSGLIAIAGLVWFVERTFLSGQ